MRQLFFIVFLLILFFGINIKKGMAAADADIKITPEISDGMVLIKNIETGPFRIEVLSNEGEYKIITELPYWIDIRCIETRNKKVFWLIANKIGEFSLFIRGEKKKEEEEGLDKVFAYPSPARGAQMTFTNLPTGKRSIITIYNIVGEEVKVIETDNSDVIWDLKNQQGLSVASGVYLYVIRCDGMKKVGKIAVLR